MMYGRPVNASTLLLGSCQSARSPQAHPAGRASNLRQQRGIATVLMIVLVGMGLTATSLGVLHSVHSTQKKHLAAHAITHAQAGTWVGVEIFRRYLAAIDQAKLDALVLNQAIDFTLPGTTNSVSAVITARTPPGTGETAYKITTRVSYTDVAAKSSAAIEVIYDYSAASTGGAGSNAGFAGVLDFHRDLIASGGIDIIDTSGKYQGNINVNGSIDMSTIGISGLGTLSSTGNVTIGSSVPAAAVYANGNVTLSGGAVIDKVSALGDIIMTGGGARANTLKNNGNVSLGGSNTKSIDSRGNVTVVTWADHLAINAGGTVSIGNGVITQATAKGNLAVTAYADVGTLASQGNVTCFSNTWTKFTSITVQGSASNCKTGAKLKTNTAVTVNVMPPLPPFEMIKPLIDVWPLKPSAHYVFEYESGKIKVTVKNVAGITDGVYYLGRHQYGTRTMMDALCKNVSSGNCTESLASTRTICQGFSQYNPCFSYDASSQTLIIDGKNIAPGVVWVKGNLLVKTGVYYNSFLATGNISTSGQTKIYASNYAGYAINCSLVYPINDTSDFDGLYPKNLCNTTTASYVPEPVGNAALIAGGKNPEAGGVYQGGDITLDTAIEIFGSVITGDYLKTNGDATVHGFVTATANTGETSINTLGGKTIIDLTNLPPSFTPNVMPNMSPQAPPATDVARVLWSRYL